MQPFLSDLLIISHKNNSAGSKGKAFCEGCLSICTLLNRVFAEMVIFSPNDHFEAFSPMIANGRQGSPMVTNGRQGLPRVAKGQGGPQDWLRWRKEKFIRYGRNSLRYDAFLLIPTPQFLRFSFSPTPIMSQEFLDKARIDFGSEPPHAIWFFSVSWSPGIISLNPSLNGVEFFRRWSRLELVGLWRRKVGLPR